MKKALREKLKKIKLLVLDFDGVLTDGYVYTDENGREMVRCSRRDGMGTSQLHKIDVDVVVISGEKNPVVVERCKKMNIEDRFFGIKNKLDILQQLMARNGTAPFEVAYVGDDINDLECLKFAGFAAAPQDCVPEVRKIVQYVTAKKGGEGAVREVCDLILEAKKETK